MIRIGKVLLAILFSFAFSVAAFAQGRSVPDPIYGITFDDVSKVNAEVNTLASIVHVPTVRIVFDRGEPASYYKGAIGRFRPVAYVMGELIDSFYMRRYQTISAVQSWTTSYVNTLGSLVDIWEIGNEINGNWLGSNAFGKMAAMYDIVAGKGGRTALTFFYEGETSEPHYLPLSRSCAKTGKGRQVPRADSWRKSSGSRPAANRRSGGSHHEYFTAKNLTQKPPWPVRWSQSDRFRNR